MWKKLNLVTQPKGDQLQCSHCGDKIWNLTIGCPYRCLKCGCFDFEEHPANRTIYGIWAPNPLGHRCTHCRGRLELVPLEGHPNSRLWALKRDDRCLLWSCKKMCEEEVTNVRSI